MNEPVSMPQEFRKRLAGLREALLGLSKALIESERVSYEQTIGKISSPNHFLKLLLSDPWFAWLHPLSQLIVAMDEALDAKTKTPLTGAAADRLVKQTRDLLVVSETGDGFPHHYFIALQRDPDVVLAHAEVAKILKSPKRP
jgi:hypothetical protein